MRVIRVHHVQLAMPPGREAEAEAFYRDVLGIPRVAKPSHLAVRGGCWFELGDVRIHLGVEEGFVPAHKAHPHWWWTISPPLEADSRRLVSK